jgi:hypothetical protein
VILILLSCTVLPATLISVEHFLYEMNRKTCTVQFNSKIGSESVELNVILDKVSPFSAKINLKTPIDGYTDMAIYIKGRSDFR